MSTARHLPLIACRRNAESRSPGRVGQPYQSIYQMRSPFRAAVSAARKGEPGATHRRGGAGDNAVLGAQDQGRVQLQVRLAISCVLVEGEGQAVRVQRRKRASPSWMCKVAIAAEILLSFPANSGKQNKAAPVLVGAPRPCPRNHPVTSGMSHTIRVENYYTEAQHLQRDLRSGRKRR